MALISLNNSCLELLNATHIAKTAEKLHVALAILHIIVRTELHVTVSMDMSVYPADGCDADTLIENDDTAMYCAKAKGHNNYQFFSANMNTRAVSVNELVNDTVD